MKYGFIQSQYDERDFKDLGVDNIKLPDYYEVPFNYRVIDQGNQGSCVSCSITEAYFFYRKSIGLDIDIPYDYCYNKRKDKSVEGMTVKEAFDILSSEGRLDVYSRVSSLDSLKRSILANGPAIIATIVRSDSTEFWNGSQNLGGHAVAVVGFDENSIIIKNSWGVSYGNGGFSRMRNEDFSKVLECWTILS